MPITVANPVGESLVILDDQLMAQGIADVLSVKVYEVGTTVRLQLQLV